MEIRDYRKEDINYIEKLGNKLHNMYKFQLDNFSRCKVVFEKNSLVGFITYSIIYERAEIIDIIIDYNFRKRGYAKKLIEACILDIENSNCNNITLEVNENNIAAINLYKKYNFEIASIRKNYYNSSDGYLMIRKW